MEPLMGLGTIRSRSETETLQEFRRDRRLLVEGLDESPGAAGWNPQTNPKQNPTKKPAQAKRMLWVRPQK
jgi:hypothetical protein